MQWCCHGPLLQTVGFKLTSNFQAVGRTRELTNKLKQIPYWTSYCAARDLVFAPKPIDYRKTEEN